MTKIEKQVEAVVLPVVNELGYELYDVEYLKEGNEWFLRLYIDNEKGINLDDCEKVSGAVGEVLDNEDPISTSYNLEVSSCGLERNLREVRHYLAAIDKKIQVKFFKPVNGVKEVEGLLKSANENEIIVNKDGNDLLINLKDIAVAKILYNWEVCGDE